MRKYLVGCLVLTSLGMWAQQPTIPADLGTVPITSDGAKRSNVIDYGMTVSADFDDNATNPANNSVGETNIKSSIQPQADIAVDRGHLASRFFYGPSFNYSTNISSYNNTAQAAGADVKYLFTKRLSLQVRDAFSLTTNPYETWQAATQLPSLGVLNQPNRSSMGANVRSRTEQAQANLVYQFGRHTSVGIGGTFTKLSYATLTSGLATNQANQDSRGWSGDAFFSHEFTARYSLGIQYTALNLSSQGVSGHFFSLSHQALGFLTVALKPKVQLSIFGGPERSELNDDFALMSGIAPTQLHRFSFAGGSSLSWQGEHNGLSASLVQQVSDSGLNSGGSLLVRMASLNLQHQIAPRWRLTFFGTYISNTQLDSLTPLFLSDSASAGLTVSRVLTPHLSLNLSALRQQFMGDSGGGPFAYLQHSHDIATVSLSYSFARPIGR